MLRAVVLAAGVAGMLVAGPAMSAAADDGPSSGTVVAEGSDVSYPQCGGVLGERGDIAVVGLNAGTGTTTNPCLAEQLAWGDADGRLADVYVNTANPGHLGDWWPSADLTRAGMPVTNPNGRCVGAEDDTCAYVYGYSVGMDDLGRGVDRPGDRTWWLDVETMNTWSWDRSANLAVLEGMTAALRGAGAGVGVYSTSRQWSVIVGSAPASSPLAGTWSWAAGAVTRDGASANCAVRPFADGGRVVMTQWVEGGQDHDVACDPAVTGSRPAITVSAVPGAALVADPGAWGPADVRLTLQWYRDGLAVPGATGTTYLPAAGDAGAAFTVAVTGTGSGPGGAAPAVSLESGPVTVSPVPPSTATPSVAQALLGG